MPPTGCRHYYRGGGLRKLDLTHGRATEPALPDCRPVAAARLVGPAGIVAGGDGVAAGPARLAPAPAALSAALCCWPVLGLFPSSPAAGRAAAGRTGWQPYGIDRAHARIATAYRHRLAVRDRAGAYSGGPDPASARDALVPGISGPSRRTVALRTASASSRRNGQSGRLR